MNPKLKLELARVLRREVTGGPGTLSHHGLIAVTDAGRAWVAADMERLRRIKSLAGKKGGKIGGTHDTNREEIARSGGLARAKMLAMKAKGK